MTTKEQIIELQKAFAKRILTTFKYQKGLNIFMEHGSKLPALRKYLSRKAGNPDFAAWETLIYQLGKILPRLKDQALDLKAEETPTSHKSGKPTKATSIKAKSVAQEIQQLAQQRDDLAQKLVDPGDDTELLEQNKIILSQQAVLNQQIKDLEAKRDKLNQGEDEETDPLAIERRGMKLKMSELEGMNVSELKSVLAQCKKDMVNYKQRTKRSNAVKPETRLANEKKMAKKQIEINLLQKLIAEKTYQELT